MSLERSRSRRRHGYESPPYPPESRQYFSGGRYDRHDDYRSKPITRRFAAGNRARLTVETGGETGGTYGYTTAFNRLGAELIESRMAGVVGDDYTGPRNKHRHEGASKYDFTLPPKPQAVTYDLVEDVSFPLDASANEDSGKPSQAGRPKFSGAITDVDISQSRWLGSANDRGDLTAEISVPSIEKKQSEKRKEPLMKWHHLERSMMSFDEFAAAAQSVLQVSAQKRRDVKKLLRDIQSRHEKQRQHGRYLVPNYVSDLYTDEKSSKESARMIFLSFPYFCLEPYNATQSKNLTSGTPIHPLRPLLQSYFHSTAQKRELAQAITKLPGTESGKCLHLSQVWCLIVDNDTMITCSRQSHDTLCDPIISKSDVSAADESTKIKVSFGNDRSWQIPVSDDTTWPAFVSVFGEDIADLREDRDDVVMANFKVNGSSVNADQWSFLVNAAQQSSVGLDLKQRFILPGSGAQVLNDLSPAISAFLSANTNATAGTTVQAQDEAYSPQPKQQNVNVDAAMTNDTSDGLAVFTHGSEIPLESLANNMDSALRSNSREEERKAYDRVVATKPLVISQWNRAGDDSPSQDSKAKLIGAALYFFLFFWDLTFDHPLIDKYWCAIDGIMKQDSRTYSAAYVDATLSRLMDTIVPILESLRRDFSASPKDLSPLPDAFEEAFLHLVMIFIVLSQTSERRKFGHRGSTVVAHVKELRYKLNAGKREITARLKSQAGLPDLEELEICSHTSLLALVLNQFSQDVMHGKPDVASSYDDYLNRLEFKITDDPAPRSHQESLRFYLQEVKAILLTLQDQEKVIDAFDESLRQQHTGADGSQSDNSLRDALGVSRQQIVIGNCRARIASRIATFKGLRQRAEDLGEWHRNEIETNKDRQENAIMVFTIVTIIFLPLSFVSSVFGMNTTDVRDMPYGQWAFWAAAAPLTVIVVIGSLWWAGEFEGFGSWVQKLLSRSRSAGGYSRIPEPVSYADRRGDGAGANARYASARTYADIPPPVQRRTATGIYPGRRHSRSGR